MLVFFFKIAALFFLKGICLYNKIWVRFTNIEKHDCPKIILLWEEAFLALFTITRFLKDYE